MVFKKVMLSEQDDSLYMLCYLHDDRPRASVVVCPGGGYHVCAPHEAEPIALQYFAAGFNAFVVFYSLNDKAVYPLPILDVSRAFKIIRDNADEWKIVSDKIAVCGFSAGGHLAASLSTLWNNAEIMELSGCSKGENQPNAAILCYPVITNRFWMKFSGCLEKMVGDRPFEETAALLDCSKNTGPHTPPSFIFHTFRDNAVAIEESLSYINALASSDVPFEAHIWPNGVHGVGLGESDPDLCQWMPLSIKWLKRLWFKDEGEQPARAK